MKFYIFVQNDFQIQKIRYIKIKTTFRNCFFFLLNRCMFKKLRVLYEQNIAMDTLDLTSSEDLRYPSFTSLLLGPFWRAVLELRWLFLPHCLTNTN